MTMYSSIVHQERIVSLEWEANSYQRSRNMAQLGSNLGRVFPSHEVMLSTVAGRNLLFSPESQQIFEINDMAAYLWSAMREGCTYETIVSELADQGVPLETAKAYLEDVLLEWSRRGLVKTPAVTAADLSDKTSFSQQIGLLGLTVLVRYGTSLFHDVAPAFRHLQVKEAAPNVVLDAIEEGQWIKLFRNGKRMFAVRGDELATALRAQLLEEALSGVAYELALHAATLIWKDRAMLLNGHPGAGKTTLTLALVNAGFGFAGDDVAFLNSQGQVTGIPFSPACKAGAWKLIAQFRPDINDEPIFRRYDRRRVRYPEPRNLVAAIPRPAGWVVFLDRRDNAAAVLTRINPVSAMRSMLRESYVQDRRLTAAGFMSLSYVANHADCYQLTYSNLDNAVDLLCRTCR
jgi:hypothetical protein